jgi:microcystin-dependent protein
MESSILKNRKVLQQTASTAFTLSYSTAPGALVDWDDPPGSVQRGQRTGPNAEREQPWRDPAALLLSRRMAAIPTGLIDANETSRVAYNSSAGAYRLLNLRNRTGEIVPFGGSTAPAGALLCYGQAINRTDYVGLFTVIRTTYGTGDGTTTFNLPDLRGRVVAGKDNMGGSAASRLTTDVAGSTLGATGGFQLQNTGANVPGGTPATNTGANIQVAPDGHQHQVSTVQPTIILNYIIRI